MLATSGGIMRPGLRPGRPAFRSPKAYPPPSTIGSFGPDKLRFYLSGAQSDGGIQAEQELSLGGCRSSVEVRSSGIFVSRAIPGLTVERNSRLSRSGGGSIQCDFHDGLSYRARNGIPGPVVRVNDGDSATLVDGLTPSEFVRVRRNRTSKLSGAAVMDYHDIYHNVIGMSEVDDALSTAGGSRYRAVMIRSVGATSNLAIWIDTLGPSAVSSITQLSGTGQGSIVGATDCFIGWPKKGWAHIADAGGALREIVYYASRTDEELNVPLNGRGRLGTTPAAGAATDVCWPVPGIRIAREQAEYAPNAAIQWIPDESTPPAVSGWSTGITIADGLAYLPMEDGWNAGLWIERETPVGASGFSQHLNAIRYAFDADGETYTGTLAGLYLVAEEALERYELHVGVNGEPDLSAPPAATFSSLPATYALAPGAEYRLVLNHRSRYDLCNQSNDTTTIVLDAMGNEELPPPTPPDGIYLEAAVGGRIALSAVYYYLADGDDPADFWAIYLRADGTDPDPLTDSPTLVPIIQDGAGAGIFSGGKYYSFPYTTGTIVRVLLRTRRSSDMKESTNAEIVEAVADESGPAHPHGRVFYRGVAEPGR